MVSEMSADLGASCISKRSILLSGKWGFFWGKTTSAEAWTYIPIATLVFVREDVS